MTTISSEGRSGVRKHEVLEAHWRRCIEAGEWVPGHRLPTMTELCDIHDVSRSTVDRVCRTLEQDGLIIRRQGSGTYVAPARARVQHGLIGFSGFGFQQRPRPAYWTQLQEGIEDAAARAEKAVLLLDHKLLTGWDKVDGVLLSGADARQIKPLLEKLPADLPRVVLLTAVDGQSCVAADDVQSGRIATNHLLELGHSRIACLMDDHEAITRRRLLGYREALLQHGVTPQAEWILPYRLPDDAHKGDAFDFMQHGYEMAREWLADGWQDTGCTALLAQNDLLAAGVLQACRDTGVTVPDELSIIGCDNLELCRHLTPQLTSMEIPLHEIGVTAMELLQRQIEEKESTPVTMMLPVRLQIRQSTAMPVD